MELPMMKMVFLLSFFLCLEPLSLSAKIKGNGNGNGNGNSKTRERKRHRVAKEAPLPDAIAKREAQKFISQKWEEEVQKKNLCLSRPGTTPAGPHNETLVIKSKSYEIGRSEAPGSSLLAILESNFGEQYRKRLDLVVVHLNDGQGFTSPQSPNASSDPQYPDGNHYLTAVVGPLGELKQAGLRVHYYTRPPSEREYQTYPNGKNDHELQELLKNFELNPSFAINGKPDDEHDKEWQEFQKRIFFALETILSHPGQTTLFHCQAGKHRTGMMGMLLRHLSDPVWAEPFDQPIVCRHCRFNQEKDGTMTAHFIKVRQKPVKATNLAELDYLRFNSFEVRPENFAAVLSLIDSPRFQCLQKAFAAYLKNTDGSRCESKIGERAEKVSSALDKTLALQSISQCSVLSMGVTAP
jgi:hypothetical protein